MSSPERVDTVQRFIHASAEDLWASFADAAAWVQWLPPTDMVATIREFEFREGGRYRLMLTYANSPGGGKTTADTDVVEGTFTTLIPDQLLVQSVVFSSDDPAYAGTMRMSWMLRPGTDGTMVTIWAENVPPGISPEDHTLGMRSTLENLARFVEHPHS